MNFYQEVDKEQEQEQIISDNKYNKKNLNYDGISEINTPISKKTIADRNIYSNRIIKPLKTFVYKSIFHIDKNINNNNIATNDMRNKNYYGYNLSNNNLKNQKVSNRVQKNADYNYYNHNTYGKDIDNNILKQKFNNTNIINSNNIDSLLINKNKYNKQYSSQIENNFITYCTSINSINDNCLNIMNSGKSLQFHKSEDNLKKKDLIEAQKEINAFDLKNDNIKYSENINRNIFYKDNKINIYEENIKKANKINILNKKEKANINDEIKKEKNNIIKRLNTSPNINNYKGNDINYININKKNYNKMNKRNISVNKENSSLYNLSNLKSKEDNKTMQISKMITTNSHNLTLNNFEIENNPSLFSNNLRDKYNNYLLSPNRNNYSSVSSIVNLKNVLKNKQKAKIVNSNNNIDNISNNNNIDLFIQNKMKNYNNSTDYNIKIDDLTNEFCKSVKSNYNIMNKIDCDNKSNKNIKTLENKSSHHNRIEFKDNTVILKNEINKKNIIIEKYLKIISEYKLKIDKLLDKNKELLEDSKKNQDALIKQIKVYQNEICNLKRNKYHLGKINNDRKNNSINIINDHNIKNEYSCNCNSHADYIKQIDELKKQIENYKIENNNLKIMLIKAENNNKGEPYLTRDNSMKIIGTKDEKRSNSVSKSKTKLRISISLKKNYEEDKKID